MDSTDLSLMFIQRLLNIRTERTSAIAPQLNHFMAQSFFAPIAKRKDYLSIIVQDIKARNIYHLTDQLGVRVSLVRTEDDICLIGPYITENLPSSELKRRFTVLRIDEKQLSAFQDYVAALPLLTMESIYTATHTLLQGVVGQNSRAQVFYVDLSESVFSRLQAESAGTPVSSMPIQLFENVITTDEDIKESNKLEVFLAEHMINGQTANAVAILNRMNALNSHQQPEEMDDLKLQAAVLCTQMRQTVLRAGVQFAVAEVRFRYFLALIRRAKMPRELEHIQSIMLAQFCDIIRKERLGNLSPKMRQIVQFILADLSGNLSVEALAAQVNLSPNYLSASFKKEIGQSLSSYILDKRLESASQFLSFTNMPIRDVAICVGITDFSYFAKVFRRKFGKTPSEYRHHSEAFVEQA